MAIDKEEPVAMSSESRKRPAEAEDGTQTKRQRLQSSHAILSVGNLASCPYASPIVTADEMAKKGLRRGIALALQKVGFEGAAPEAMESFVAMAETCTQRQVLTPLRSMLTRIYRHYFARRRREGLHQRGAALPPRSQGF